MNRLPAALLLSALAALPAAAAEKSAGPKVGDAAPSFSLKDQNGEERPLSEFLKKGKVALVFYRSAEWCPFCKAQLAQLQKDREKFEKAGVHVVAVSYDSPETLSAFAAKSKITFPLLSDPGSKTIKAYGLLNEEANGKAAGIAHPATLLLDGKGVVRAKLMLEGYRKRTTADDIVEAASKVK